MPDIMFVWIVPQRSALRQVRTAPSVLQSLLSAKEKGDLNASVYGATRC